MTKPLTRTESAGAAKLVSGAEIEVQMALMTLALTQAVKKETLLEVIETLRKGFEALHAGIAANTEALH